MALISCVECGTEVSDRSETCVKCGAPTALSVSERELGRFTPSMLAQEPMRLFWLSMLALFTCGFGLVFMLPWYLQLQHTVLTVTNRRVQLTTGWFTKASSELMLDHIRNVTLNQTALQRMVGAGDLGISSSGQSGVELQVKGIQRCDELKALVDAHRTD